MSEDTIIALALHQAADEFDLNDLAWSQFTASDGLPSAAVSTNEQAKERVKEWIHARARKIQEG